jgi:hypothetical protein
VSQALYLFGDASGAGFGSSLVIDGSVHYQHGQWNASIAQEYSNFRELANLVTAIQDCVKHGLLTNSELFVFTDNSTAEAAFYKGASSSRKLFNLILCLRKMQMQHNLHLHMVHISGHRMIAQGTDSLSRGAENMGKMTGVPMSVFVPLHQSASEHQGNLAEWVTSWFKSSADPIFLDHKDWYLTGQKYKCCVWTPPPAAADAVLEQLAWSTHKRPYHMHLVLIPRLLIPVGESS